MTDQQNPSAICPSRPLRPIRPRLSTTRSARAGRAVLRRRPNRSAGLRPLPGPANLPAALPGHLRAAAAGLSAGVRPARGPGGPGSSLPDDRHRPQSAPVAFIFCILSLVGSVLAHHSAAWMIPMSVISWASIRAPRPTPSPSTCAPSSSVRWWPVSCCCARTRTGRSWAPFAELVSSQAGESG